MKILVEKNLRRYMYLVLTGPGSSAHAVVALGFEMNGYLTVDEKLLLLS